MAEELMFMVRAKLPSSVKVTNMLSDDVDKDYSREFKDACFAAKPQGFEIKWPRNGESWPIDSEGYTFIPLYLTDRKEGHLYFIERTYELEKQLKYIKSVLEKLI